MSFDDISTFLDLVSNPTKYQEALKSLQEEQAKLTAVIEATVKVGEIDKKQKQVDIKLSKADAILAEAEAQGKVLIENASKAYEAQVVAVVAREEAANKKMAEAVELKNAADATSAEFRATKKQQDIREANLLERERKLAEDQAELASRLEKLRGAMV
jgi:hypothetical protein